jgi:2,5-diamino-6-(ribosylamino)-4(3H)-pyrimidinone 5'-phosphate reductase
VSAEPVYDRLSFPPAPSGRPYVFVNMVTTIDGKILSGGRDEPVADLGSPTDHATMRRIEEAADAVLIGAGSLRATPGLWYPARLKRYVATESGRVDPLARFFFDAPERAWVVAPAQAAVPEGLQSIRSTAPVDWRAVLATLKTDHMVDRLLVEGGSELNAALLGLDLVDELFWTVAPKVKLGRDVPTYADGEPLPRGALLTFTLLSVHQKDDELFLRYRRVRP